MSCCHRPAARNASPPKRLGVRWAILSGLSLKPLSSKIVCVVAGAEVEGAALVVHYTPTRGYPPDIEDHIVFGAESEIATIGAVGRFLRLLRAGRIRAPSDPYGLHRDLDQAAALAQRCRGTRVGITVKRRFDRTLSVWTESGVERVRGILDCEEHPDALVVRRRGGQSALRISRDTLIRFEVATVESLEVVGVETIA